MGTTRATGLVLVACLAGVGLQACGLQGAEGVPLLWPRQVGGVKVAVAGLATALLALRAWRRGRASVRERRAGDAALALLGALGVLCWTNLLQFNYPGFGHPSDTFHYYLGAKYFPELRYTRLYRCVAVADAEAGLRDPRPLRDLASNELVSSATALTDPETCRAHFTPPRWQSFRHDVDFLRARVLPDRWARFQQDHGYNATPVWGILGHALANTAPASDLQIFALRALDPLLLLCLAAGIVWAFGWRVACVAAIYFGTNYAAPYGWTGGSILRQDWLAAGVLGLCALRRERFATGGALLALATLLRLFPGLLVAGVLLGIAGRMLRQRSPRPTRDERAFVLGGLALVAVAVPISLWTAGPTAWSDFAANSRVHLETPLANHVGLRTVLAYDPDMRTERARDASLEDPMQRWKEARKQRAEQRRGLFLALAVLFAGVVAWAGAGRPLWVGGVLGVALIPVTAELTAYYWSVLLALAFLARRHPWMAPALCALSVLGWAVASLWHWTDQIHVWLSVLTVAFCVFTARLVATRPVGGGADQETLVKRSSSSQ